MDYLFKYVPGSSSSAAAAAASSTSSTISSSSSEKVSQLNSIHNNYTLSFVTKCPVISLTSCFTAQMVNKNVVT